MLWQIGLHLWPGEPGDARGLGGAISSSWARRIVFCWLASEHIAAYGGYGVSAVNASLTSCSILTVPQNAIKNLQLLLKEYRVNL